MSVYKHTSPDSSLHSSAYTSGYCLINASIFSLSFPIGWQSVASELQAGTSLLVQTSSAGKNQ